MHIYTLQQYLFEFKYQRRCQTADGGDEERLRMRPYVVFVESTQKTFVCVDDLILIIIYYSQIYYFTGRTSKPVLLLYYYW